MEMQAACMSPPMDSPNRAQASPLPEMLFDDVGQATMNNINLADLDANYRTYCESRDDEYPDEEYLTEQKFAERYVGDFLDWLEEKQTGKRPQPEIVVRCHRNEINLDAIERMKKDSK